MCTHVAHKRHIAHFFKNSIKCLCMLCTWCVYIMCLVCAHNVTWGCAPSENTRSGLSNAPSHVFLRQKLVAVTQFACVSQKIAIFCDTMQNLRFLLKMDNFLRTFSEATGRQECPIFALRGSFDRKLSIFFSF